MAGVAGVVTSVVFLVLVLFLDREQRFGVVPVLVVKEYHEKLAKGPDATA
jgi:hypothetical protein